MKRWMLLFGLLVVPATADALEKITEPGIKEFFAETVRKNGYFCESCRDVYILDEDQNGFIYRVICNNNVLSFTVIITPAGKVLVQPW